MGKKNKSTAAPAHTLALLLPLLAAAIVALLLAGGGSYYYQSQVLQAQQQQGQAQQLAQLIAHHAQQAFQASSQQLALLAQRDDLNQALASGQLNAIDAHQLQWLPNASLRLVPRQGAQDDLSYTAQELISKAYQGNPPAPALIAGKEPALVLVQPSANQQGVLLLRQSLQDSIGRFQGLAPAGSQLTVQYGGSRLFTTPVNASGAQGQASAGPVQVSLTLAATSDDLLLVSGAAMGLGLLLVLICGWLVQRRLNLSLRQDAAELIRYNEELARQPGVTARNRFHFPVFSTVTGSQAKLAAKLRDHAPTITGSKPPAKIEAHPLAADEEDGILLMDDAPCTALPESIFRAYDIRGVAGDTLTAEGVEQLGRAIGSEAGERGQQSVLVARDGRLSSPQLSEALIKGLRATGRDVIDLGLVPTPVLYYATEVLDTRTGVMVTGSHNPPDHNGLKIVIDGETLYGERIQALKSRIEQGTFSAGEGRLEQRDIGDRYLSEVAADMVLAKPLRIAIDCGNGATGELAPQLFSQLGCEVTSLFTEIDGKFPNHAPDPGEPDNLADLTRIVEQENLDLGLAFDGDGDRLAVVTNSGEIIWPDRLLMLFAKDLLNRSPGADILFDVKCSRALPDLIRKLGGRPQMYKSGHSLIKARMKEIEAPLGGEISGHLFFADRWYGCDDGLYAGARLLEILSLQDDNAAQVFAGVQTGPTTPALHIAVDEARKFALVDALAAQADQFPGGRASTIDGLRVDFPDGWGLVRASNTGANLVARFEGQDEDALQRIQTLFHNQLMAVDDSLELPF